MSRWITYPTLDPLDPCSGNKTEVRFPEDFLQRLNKYRPVDYYNLRTAAKVLDEPTRIFYGTREFREGGWCYVGKPEQWWVRERTNCPFPKHLVFAVYLDDSLFVYAFRAEKADPNDELNPEKWEERYQTLIWKKSP